MANPQKLRDLLLDDLVAFEQILQLCESSAPNKEEIAQHARDGIVAIEILLGRDPKQVVADGGSNGQ